MIHGLFAAIEEMRRPTPLSASSSISNGSSVIRRTVPATRRGRSSSSSTTASWLAGSGMGIRALWAA